MPCLHALGRLQQAAGFGQQPQPGQGGSGQGQASDADLRAKTPTAAGELVVPVAADLRALLDDHCGKLDLAIDAALRDGRQRLAALAKHRALAGPAHQVALRRQRLDEWAERLDQAAIAVVERQKERLVAAAARLDALSPMAVIGRGYSVLRDANGKVVRRLDQAPPGAAIKARLTDGWLEAEVTKHCPQRLGEAGKGYGVT